MGFEEFPKRETMASWQERIVQEAAELYKSSLQNRELEGEELEEGIEQFRQAAQEIALDKKNEWGAALEKAGGDDDDEGPEEVERKLARGLLIAGKEKLKEIA